MSEIINEIENPRDIKAVHILMIKKIPDSEKDFKLELNKYTNSLWNIAPELRTGSCVFISYFEIMLNYIPNYYNLTNDDPRWMFECRDIFARQNTIEGNIIEGNILEIRSNN